MLSRLQALKCLQCTSRRTLTLNLARSSAFSRSWACKNQTSQRLRGETLQARAVVAGSGMRNTADQNQASTLRPLAFRSACTSDMLGSAETCPLAGQGRYLDTADIWPVKADIRSWPIFGHQDETSPTIPPDAFSARGEAECKLAAPRPPGT